MEMFTRSRYDTALRMNSQNTRNQRTRLILAPVIAYSLPGARGKPLVATHFRRRVSDCRGDHYVIFSRSQCSWFSVHLLFSESQRIEFTPEWQGDRFPDGRPKVPDSVLARLKDVSADEAWDVLQDAGYRSQFEGGWKVINPGERLVGRVVTAVFMPKRPDLDSVIRQNGKKE